MGMTVPERSDSPLMGNFAERQCSLSLWLRVFLWLRVAENVRA